jgi:hypothetical protein
MTGRAASTCLAAALLVAGWGGTAATAVPTLTNSRYSVSVRNLTAIPIDIAAKGQLLETVPAGAVEDPIKAPLPPRPWAVEARSPGGRVLATMTVGPNDSLSYNPGKVGMADLACGRVVPWTGNPMTGGPTFIPDPSRPRD